MSPARRAAFLKTASLATSVALVRSTAQIPFNRATAAVAGEWYQRHLPALDCMESDDLDGAALTMEL